MRLLKLSTRNIDEHSLAIIDELGRGTSTRDGLAIALSIAETLVESKAMIWFVTHFNELGKCTHPLWSTIHCLMSIAQIMQHRPGVVNQHLAVDTSEENTMSMMYKVQASYVKEAHYGLALARVVDLPPQVLKVAERVTKTLDAQVEAKRKSSKSVAIAKRRKLVMSLKETLHQAAASPMEPSVLLSWLKKLQEEFIRRMDAIDNDVPSSDEEDDEEDDEDEEYEGEGPSQQEIAESTTGTSGNVVNSGRESSSVLGS